MEEKEGDELTTFPLFHTINQIRQFRYELYPINKGTNLFIPNILNKVEM